MAYVAGTANSANDLLTALQGACTGNGWTLSGTILSKGACYMQVAVTSGYLTVLGGTGNSSGALVSPATPAAALGKLWAADPFAFPLTYEIHVNAAPDEVYLVVNYAVDRWQWLAFGSSPVAGLPGTGNWFGASLCRAVLGAGIGMSVSQAGWNTYQAPALFWSNTSASNYWTGVIHHGLDGLAWSAGALGGNRNCANALDGESSLLQRQPNTWNSEVALLPIQPCVARASSKVSMVGDLGHARYLRNDNLSDGAIITLGPDRWKAYPWYRKNSAQRDGVYTTALDHSGTLGWAVRYTGP